MTYTEAEVLATEADYVALIRAIGPGFHPDTRGADYTSLPAGYTAARVDAIVERAFAVYWDPEDVYGQALDLIHAMDAGR